ncbi:hypothetical protein RS3R6_36060 [Pseudomonas atacamensis]|uniref:Uncharacterized protein n=1 Tax=Pseudomonas atacamensis TaxID=2565368 RepID=A0ABQ5PHV5_9PSED|nr:hypothetical protein RS3R1_21590 [Pseudomonas atacamensis]GLH55424.1 hypothetical protein RS3R6_36060 [Pseudomonas atacamensis]
MALRRDCSANRVNHHHIGNAEVAATLGGIDGTKTNETGEHSPLA